MVILLTRFPRLFKGEGTDDSEQVRRTQTCAHWLMIKPYINVRYDRLHRDGVQNPNDAAHRLSFASFASLTRLHSSVHLTGDLGRYCYSLVDRDVRATFRYLCGTQTSAGMPGGAAICSHCNKHHCFKLPDREIRWQRLKIIVRSWCPAHQIFGIV